ncbi:hypothetical protein [Ramlibacter tataouinensis]|uniref:hypothetical protein n=1 Tax=Ramlibacter tataouinensis TaxID=94132 RepID=UPI00117DC189|nr:hypothetical protein [Ramlibacter tataouinensis]
MSISTRTILFGAAALAASLPLAAQIPGATQPSAGTSASATYASAFEGYRPFAAGDVQDWRKSNDTVRDIGGWRAYAREIAGSAPDGAGQAQGPAAQPARQGQAPAVSPKATDPHQGHPK